VSGFVPVYHRGGGTTSGPLLTTLEAALAAARHVLAGTPPDGEDVEDAAVLLVAHPPLPRVVATIERAAGRLARVTTYGTDGLPLVTPISLDGSP
jgi:hypothetical protein